MLALGSALARAGRPAEAAEVLEAAGHEHPGSPPLLRLLGTSLLAAGRLEQALSCLEQAAALAPEHPGSHQALGVVLARLGRFCAAAESFRRAVSLAPANAEAWNNLAAACHDQGLHEEGRRASEQALALAPDSLPARANFLFYANTDPSLAPADLFERHRSWGRRLEQLVAPDRLPHGPPAEPERMLRIGYLSPDLRGHSVAFFIMPLLLHHDRRRFEIVGYFDHAAADAITAQIRPRCDLFREVAHLGDAALSQLIRQDDVDILVDLAGYSSGGRMGVLARRPAPVQVSYLGYLNTTGLSTVDARITDALADPPGRTEGLHTERLLRPFPSFLCYMPPSAAPQVAEAPSLREGRPTFGSFNHLRKLSEAAVRLFAAVLRQEPGARLLLKCCSLGEPACSSRVRSWFAAEGIEGDRLELRGPQAALGEHLASYALVDVALDSFPYHGTTTTCEALWMGVPVVTLAGNSHRSRVGASVLGNVGLGQLVAENEQGFVERAVEVARDVAWRAELRAGLREGMACSPLMDGAGHARALCDAYVQLWRGWCAHDAAGGGGS
ncbi:MAG: tetratricopeptide repeat protein [Deltaproteobacteria bacterium]|nr:tetratricopeptide repeat protein [Deltaproteobacteria bacterium]